MTNKDLGLLIWKKIKFDDTNFYKDNFDYWYKDCFDECMEEALRTYNNNERTEISSFIEISRNISTSGNNENINVYKENFLEWFGEEDFNNYFYGDEHEAKIQALEDVTEKREDLF